MLKSNVYSSSTINVMWENIQIFAIFRYMRWTSFLAFLSGLRKVTHEIKTVSQEPINLKTYRNVTRTN